MAAVTGSLYNPATALAKANPVEQDLRHLAEIYSRLADGTHNERSRTAIALMHEALDRLDDEDSARLDKFSHEVQLAISSAERMFAGNPRRARSDGYPEPGTNVIYPDDSNGSVCTTKLTRDALIAAQVTDTALTAASHGCEQTAPVVPAGCANLALACSPLAIAANVARIFYNQRDLCSAINDRLAAEAFKDQAGHVHGDIEDLQSDLDSKSSDLRDRLLAIASNLTDARLALRARADAINTRLGTEHVTITNDMNNLVNDINSRSTQIDNEVAAHRANLNNRATTIDNKLIALQNHQTNRANIIDAELDDSFNQMRSLGAQRREAIERSSIERVLSEHHIRPMGYFILPASFGGRLELVRQFVDEAIQAAIAAGRDPVSARAYLVRGDDASANGLYKAAHIFYRRAYRETVR